MDVPREGRLHRAKPCDRGNWYFITRRGKRVRDHEDFIAIQKASVLTPERLHPVISKRIWANYLGSNYDTAIFQSFKEIEVAVREGAGLPADLVGVPLVRDAFDPKKENSPISHFRLRNARQWLISLMER